MLLGSNPSIEDKIVELTSSRPLSPKQIWSELGKMGTQTTIQGVYKAVRQLLADSVVVKDRKKIAVSQEWVGRLVAMLAPQGDTFDIKDGEGVTYRFRSLTNLDVFWKHAVISFLRQHEGAPIFHYNPHEVWIHIDERRESQEEYLRSFENNERLGYMILGGDTVLDKEYKRLYQNHFLSIDTLGPDKFGRRHEHITILNDYIITTVLPEDVAGRIDKIYETASSGETLGQQIANVFNSESPAKLRLERNAVKAKKLRKKISKNFYIPQGVIEKFDLY